MAGPWVTRGTQELSPTTLNPGRRNSLCAPVTPPTAVSNNATTTLEPSLKGRAVSFGAAILSVPAPSI